jgi:hypothetical protein
MTPSLRQYYFYNVCEGTRASGGAAVASLAFILLLAALCIAVYMSVTQPAVGSKLRWLLNLTSIVLASTALFFCLLTSAVLGSNCYKLLSGHATVSSENFSLFSVGFAASVGVAGPIVSTIAIASAVLRLLQDKRAGRDGGKADVGPSYSPDNAGGQLPQAVPAMYAQPAQPLVAHYPPAPAV